MGQSADQVRQEIDHKREDAAYKIDQIEERVEGTMHQAQDTVEQSITKAQEGVEQTVTKVKESFDVRQQIEERPLMALGAALVGGFVLGGMMGGDGGGGGQPHVEGQRTPAYGSHRQSGGVMHGIRQAAKSTGFEDTLTNMAAAFMGTATEKMKAAADQNLPGFAEKFQSAQQTGGGLSSKAHATQESTTSSPIHD